MHDIGFYERLRQRMIEERVRELMAGNTRVDQDDYSLTLPANLAEFMQECQEADQADLIALIASGNHYFESSEFFERLGRSFFCAYKDYWKKLATSRAEFETPDARSLREDDHADTADARIQASRDNMMGAYRHAA